MSNGIDSDTGLTLDELEVMGHLVDSVMKYAALPLEHPHELEEFLTCVHRLQDLMAIRVTRRSFPNGWYRVKT